VQARAPLGGITNGGWQLVYNETPNVRMAGNEKPSHSKNLMYSIGLSVYDDGWINDVQPDTEAAKAGIVPGLIMVREDGKPFSLDDFATMVADSKNSTAPIKIITENGGVRQTFTVNYHGGARYPHLVRDETKPDILSEIIKGH